MGRKDFQGKWFYNFSLEVLVSTEKGATVFIEKGAGARLKRVSRP
jgi:hypothetical protein